MDQHDWLSYPPELFVGHTNIHMVIGNCAIWFTRLSFNKRLSF